MGTRDPDPLSEPRDSFVGDGVRHAAAASQSLRKGCTGWPRFQSRCNVLYPPEAENSLTHCRCQEVMPSQFPRLSVNTLENTVPNFKYSIRK